MSMLPFSFPRVNPALLFVAFLLPEGRVLSGDWPRYRGPGLDGISTEEGLQAAGEAKVRWRSEVGLGYSAPVIGGGRVVISGHDGKETDTVYCFDEGTGEVRWKFSYPQPLGDLYFQGGTTATATIDGNRVYHVAREGELFCFDAASGKVVWQKHLNKDFGYTKPTWGFSGAPLVWDGWLFVNAGDSGINLKKDDGSVITEFPSASERTVINWAWRSVGNPGWGWVVTSTGRRMRSLVTRTQQRMGSSHPRWAERVGMLDATALHASTCTPMVSRQCIAERRLSTGQFSRMISPLVTAAAIM